MTGADARTTPLPPQPWYFRWRAFVFGAVYFLGFAIGIPLQFILFHQGWPAYVILGGKWGSAGIHAAAFVAAAFALTGFMLRWWGASYLSSGIVWNPGVTAAELRVDGPYRYVRNPLYVGNVLQSVGVGMLGTPIALLIIVLGVVIVHHFLIGAEERQLLAEQGDAFREYCQRVPRMWPRLTPAQFASSTVRPSWLDGFSSEVFSSAFALIMLFNALVTWANPWPYFGVLFFGAFLLQVVVRLFMRPRNASAA